jgi:eukaryotic-like serine/threonine-protein kinase
MGRAGPRYNYGRDPLLLRHALALHGAGQLDAAREAIRIARQDLLAVAAKIPDESVRNSYLENIAPNAETLKLAREWLGE